MVSSGRKAESDFEERLLLVSSVYENSSRRQTASGINNKHIQAKTSGLAFTDEKNGPKFFFS